jgi:GNAT superfamily N-acetyltransferase
MGVLEFPFVIDAYETLPPAFVRQNPAYYHALLKDAGFETERGLVDYRIAVRPELLEVWRAAVAGAERRGFELRTLATLTREQRIDDFTRLWNETFAGHFGYVPFTAAEFAAIQEALTPVGMLDLSLMVFRAGAAVGVLWAVPDTSFLAALAPGRTLAGCERVNFLGLGVRAAARGQGLNLAMPAHAYLALAARGATHVSYTLVLDDNWPSRRTAEKLGAEVCADYVVYRRELGR